MCTDTLGQKLPVFQWIFVERSAIFWYDFLFTPPTNIQCIVNLFNDLSKKVPIVHTDCPDMSIAYVTDWATSPTVELPVLSMSYQSCRWATNPVDELPVMPWSYKSCRRATSPAVELQVLPLSYNSCHWATSPAVELQVLPLSYKSCCWATSPLLTATSLAVELPVP